MKKPKILFIYGRDRQERIRRLQAGEGPDEFLYGYNHFATDHYDMQYLDRRPTDTSLKQRLWKPWETLIAHRVQIGFSLHFALEHLQQLRQADVLVSTVDALGLPIAALKYYGWLKTPLLYISQGLTD